MGPRVEMRQSAADAAFGAHRWVATLCNWRAVLAAWQAGHLREDDPSLAAIRDHREATLQLRAEVNALTHVLIRKGAFTHSEYIDALGTEARLMCEQLERKYPGFVATDAGVTVDDRAMATARGWYPSEPLE